MLPEKGSLVSGPVEWTLTVDELFNNEVSRKIIAMGTKRTGSRNIPD